MFDASEILPWEQPSPSPMGTAIPRASEQGSFADPLLSHPTFPQANPITGALIVDPDIQLRAKGFDLELSFFYNSRSSTNGAYGVKRSFSANCYVLRGNDADHIQVVRGDENIYVFAPGSTVGSIKNYTPDPKQYSGTTLVYDSSVTSFIETFPDGKQMIYGTNQGGVDFTRFALSRIQDPSGNRHTYTYSTGSEANLLKSIQVPGGRLLTLTYQPATGPTSLVNAVQDWGGRIITFQYDTNRQLTTMTTPLGCSTKYAYAHAGASEDMLNVIEDSRGFATTYMYDGHNRVTTVAAGSGIWTNTYGGSGLGWSGSARMEPNGAVTTYLVTTGRISNVQHAEGYTTTYEYDTNGYQTKQIEPYGTVASVSYNSSGQPLVAFDALGYATTYQYDASRNLTTVTDALGNISSFTYDGSHRMTARIDPLGRRTTYAWNSDSTLQSMQDGRGLLTTNAYDAFGNMASILQSDGSVITYGYDNLNRMTSSQMPGDTVGTSIVYDGADHVIATVDLNGARSTSVYDACLLVASVNPLNERTTYTYNRFRSQETVTNPLGFVSTWVYDTMNRQTATVDALGYRTTVIYSGNRKVGDMDALGYLTTYLYDTSNRPIAVQDARGSLWTNVYDTRNLVARKDPLGNLSTSVYDKVNRKIVSVSPLGYRSTSTFDAAGQLAASASPMGFITSFQYDGNGQRSVVQDANNKLTTTTYFSNRNLPESVTDPMGSKRVVSVAAGSGIWTNTYGGSGWSGSARMEPNGAVTTYLVTAARISQIVHPENYTTTYSYDSNGYQSKQTEPYGVVSSVTYNTSGLPLVAYDALGYATTYQYDASLNLTTVINALGNISSMVYDAARRMTAQVDPLGRRTTYAWNSDGTLQSVKDPRGLLTTSAYDAVGNLASVLNSDGSVVTFGYDILGRRTSSQMSGDTVARSFVYDVGDHLVATVDLIGARSTSVYDACLLVASVNPLNERTTFAYNRFHSRETVMNPLGFVSTMVYDNMNRPLAAINALGFRTTQVYLGSRKVADMDALGYLTSYSYDVSNRPSAVQDARGNVWTNVFDARNLVARMDPLGNLSTSVYDKVGRQIASVSPLGLRSTSVYDAAGQLSASITPLGFITTFGYDVNGQRTVVQDANNKLTTTAYFANRNLPESVTDAMGFKSTYAYDQQSRLVSTRDANGGYVTNLYDSDGRLQFVQNQLGQNARQYGYDLAGRVVTMADAANRVRSYTYDVNGQSTATIFPDGKIATFAYDPIGQRTTLSDWGGVSTYAYDARSQMRGKTEPASIQAYNYDPVGNRTTLTLDGTGTFTSTYDVLSRSYVSQKPDGLLYTMQYDADSRRTTLLLGKGSRRQYGYDQNSRLTTQIELNASNVQICTILDAYDPVGNRNRQEIDGVVATWTYDDKYRLTGQIKPGQVCTYTMDPVGNLLVMWEGGPSPKTMTYDVIDRLTTMAEGANLTTYTFNGFNALASEITGGDTTAYVYSGQDQLIGVTQPTNGLSTYAFDGNGLRRTAQEGNVLPTTMVWDGSDYVQVVGPSTTQTVLTVGSEILATESKDLLTDPLGSLAKEISSGANLSSLIENYPYGKAVSGTGTPTTPFVFIGKFGYYKDTIDRDYVRARALYKSLGRWLQVDSFYPENRAFEYADNNPTLLVDPSGKFIFLIALVPAAVVLDGCLIVALSGMITYICCQAYDYCSKLNSITCTAVSTSPWTPSCTVVQWTICISRCKPLSANWCRPFGAHNLNPMCGCGDFTLPLPQPEVSGGFLHGHNWS